MKRLILFLTLVGVCSAAVADTDKVFEQCRAKLKKSQKLDVLYDLKWEGSTLRVVVGPTFYKIPIDAKEGFIETVNCFVNVGKPNCLNFDVLDWQTGKKIGRFESCSFSMN